MNSHTRNEAKIRHTPFLSINRKKITEQYETLTKELPGVRVHYAVKCNPDREILSVLAKLGAGFEIASLGELERLIEAGIGTEKVIYSNPVKPVDHIVKASKLGIEYFAFDNEQELSKLSKHAPGSKVILRLSVSNNGSRVDLSNKFGVSKKLAVELLQMAKKLKLSPVGLTFHVGSQSTNLNSWRLAFNDARYVMGKMEAVGHKLSLLNIGGGFPVKYEESVPTISQVSKEIKKGIKNLPYEVKILCEPGRFIVAEAGRITATVIGTARRGEEEWLYLDVGRFQCFVELFESDQMRYPVSHVNPGSSQPSTGQTSYTITGPTCDSYDTIMRNVILPSGIQMGDRLSFEMAGAYTVVYGSPFNDFPVPRTVYDEKNVDNERAPC